MGEKNENGDLSSSRLEKLKNGLEKAKKAEKYLEEEGKKLKKEKKTIENKIKKEKEILELRRKIDQIKSREA